MKKAKQYILCFAFIAVMAFAAGCGTSNGSGANGSTQGATGGGQTGTQESTRPAANGQSSEGGSVNGPTDNSTDGADVMESTGVIDGLTNDMRNGARDLMDGAENAVTGTTAGSTQR